MKKYQIAIAGTGYVGLVTGVCLAEHGHQVYCVDSDIDKINMLRNGQTPIYEPGLSELLVKNNEKLVFTNDYKKAYSQADVIMIGVATPETETGAANLEYVYEVTKQIACSLKKDCIVVIKSTVPIGTNDIIEKMFNELIDSNIQVTVASNPEFLSQGSAINDTLHASRIVIGTENPYSERVLKEIYEPFNSTLVFTNRRTAELIKYASNDFLALKISYINEIANLCELIGADIEAVSYGMGLDRRIGKQFLNAGIGYGGSCFPKDTKALHWLAGTYDYELKTIKAAIEINEIQKKRLLEKSKKYYKSLRGLTVCVLGLTFKPGTDDLREAPSVVNIPLILEAGAIVKAYDPVGIANFKKFASQNNLDLKRLVFYKTIHEALDESDVCFIFTEWPEIEALEEDDFKGMRNKIILDGRNCFDKSKMKNLVYECIGR